MALDVTMFTTRMWGQFWPSILLFGRNILPSTGPVFAVSPDFRVLPDI